MDDLKSEYALCKTGQSQSPIDIAESTTGSTDLVLDYKISPVKILNNGHTIQVNLDGKSVLKTGGKEYKLIQFHFHAPSEHSINGKPAALVIHLVHANAEKELAVLGLLFQVGAENPALADIFSRLPSEKSPETDTGISLNLSKLLPANLSHFAYSGSLTTPPCSEGVSWFVVHAQQSISAVQLKAFTSIFNNNVRPLQPLNGRLIKKAE